MDLPKRKPTRLKDYNYNQNGYYFITICTKDKQKILCDIVGGGAFDAPKTVLSEKGKIAQKYILSTNNIPEINVEKYVIMPNHIHLILSVENTSGTSRAVSAAASVGASTPCVEVSTGHLHRPLQTA